MTKPQSFLAPITLLAPLPASLPAPKFQLGQTVLWSSPLTADVGQIIGVVFADGVSVCQTGYHYAIRLDAQSPASQDCVADWAFEEDLAFMATHTHLAPRLSGAQPEVRF
jgi:hypothetical protein